MGKTISFRGKAAAAFVGALRKEKPSTEEAALDRIAILVTAHVKTEDFASARMLLTLLRTHSAQDACAKLVITPGL